MAQAADFTRGLEKLAAKHLACADRSSPKEGTDFYLQPLPFGRTGVLEMNVYLDQGDPEGVKRGLAMAAEAVPFICGGGGMLDRPYGGVNSGVGWVQTPMLGNYYEFLRGLKTITDPSNIMNPGRLALPADPAEV